jgi:hypothetical protein
MHHAPRALRGLRADGSGDAARGPALTTPGHTRPKTRRIAASLSTASRKDGPPSKFQAGRKEETNVVCGPWVARPSTPSSARQLNSPSSCGVILRVVTNAAVRADRDLRKMRSRIASPSTNGPRMSPPEPRAVIGKMISSVCSPFNATVSSRQQWTSISVGRLATG